MLSSLPSSPALSLSLSLSLSFSFFLSQYLADKQIGEVCGGPYGIRGRCLQDLSCTVDSAEFLTGNDVQGICLSKCYMHIVSTKCIEQLTAIWSDQYKCALS